MLVRVAVIAGACVLGAAAAGAEELNPEQARAFVAGKLFSYTCFDGTVGMGRIFADGSVIGTIRPGGRGEMRFANLPPGTLRVEGSSMCAHLSGMMLTPCFRVEKIDYRRFRGSISGLGFAYCDFAQHNARAEMISRAPDQPHTRMTSRVPPPPGAQAPPTVSPSAPLVSVQSAPMAPPQPPAPPAAADIAKPGLQPGLTIEAVKPAPSQPTPSQPTPSQPALGRRGGGEACTAARRCRNCQTGSRAAARRRRSRKTEPAAARTGGCEPGAKTGRHGDREGRSRRAADCRNIAAGHRGLKIRREQRGSRRAWRTHLFAMRRWPIRSFQVEPERGAFHGHLAAADRFDGGDHAAVAAEKLVGERHNADIRRRRR